MASLTVLYIIFFILGAVAAFTQKSECLLHFSRDDEAETEGEENEEGGGGGGGEYDGGGGGGAYEGGGREGVPGHTRRHNSEEEDIEETGHTRQDQVGQGQQSGRRYLDEEGEWEDARRRRKRGDTEQEFGSLRTHDALVGQLSCGPDTIHVLNVSVGYSSTRHCYQASVGCQAGSSQAKQVIHCQGNTGSCVISIGRHYLIRCGHQANFALVFYECIPASKQTNICSNTNMDISDALVLTSPNYPDSNSPQPSLVSSDIVTCECTLRAPGNSHLELEYLRTNLPITGTTCDGDMLVLERPDPVSDGRYLMEREICGHNVSNHVRLTDHIMRVTFLTGSPASEGKKGFLAKFTALSPEGLHEIFHVTCVDGHPGPSLDSLAKLTAGQSNVASRKSTTPSSNPSAYVSRLLSLAKGRGRTLPPNFDPINVPTDFLNLTREQLLAKLEQRRAQTQKIIGAQNEGPGSSGASGSSSQDSTSSGGILSGVVASLSSVVLILGSIGAFIFYRRHQRRKQQNAPTPENGQQSQTGSSLGGKMSNGSLTKGCDSVPSVKNQNRPLPDPNVKTSESNSSTHSAVNGNGASESMTQGGRSEQVKIGQGVVGSKGQITNSDGQNIYCVATSIPASTEFVDGIVKLPNKFGSSTPNLMIRLQTNTPPYHSEKSCQSNHQPIPPQRKRRQSSINLNNNLENDVSCPYDNASDVESRNQESVYAESSDDNPPNIDGEISAKNSFIIDLGQHDDEDYSYIDDINLKVLSSDEEDNTEA